MRELLEQYEFEEDTPIIRGSALGALNGVAKWEDSVIELMDAVDNWIQAVSYTHLTLPTSGSV